jgi:O-antigen ligase
VLDHPLTGLGTGVSFIGQESGQVVGQTQNGPIDIWVRYGLVGEIVFWVLYYRLFAAVWRRRRGARYTDQLAWGIGAYLFGQFIVVCTVYSWPFDTPEKAILSFSVIAMAFPWRPEDHGSTESDRGRRAPGWGAPKSAPSDTVSVAGGGE